MAVGLFVFCAGFFAFSLATGHMGYLTCFALEKWFSGPLVFFGRTAVIFIAVFASMLQNSAVWSGLCVVLAALATEITAALVATKNLRISQIL